MLMARQQAMLNASPIIFMEEKTLFFLILRQAILKLNNSMMVLIYSVRKLFTGFASAAFIAW
jgi:hypothetical protein